MTSTKYDKDQDIRELTLEQQLERMTEQRNALIIFIQDWTYRLSGEQSNDNCNIHPAEHVRRLIRDLQRELEFLEMAEPSKEDFTSKGVEAAVREIIGNPYVTEGRSPESDESNPDWDQYPFKAPQEGAEEV